MSVDSYAQRAEARKALSEDETWKNNYIKKMLKMLVKQVLTLITETYNEDGKQGSRSLNNYCNFFIILKLELMQYKY